MCATEARLHDEQMTVEVFSLLKDRTPIEELVTAVLNSERWRDRVKLTVTRFDSWTCAETPYGMIRDNTVVVDGRHVIPKPDYWTLVQALEDCENLPRVR